MAKVEPFNHRLLRLRTERGLSQRALQADGISYAYISRLEGGARTPSIGAIRKLARKLGVNPVYLETGRMDACPHCGGTPSETFSG